MVVKQGYARKVKVQMNDNLRSFLGIKRKDRVTNEWTRELYGVTKGWMKGLMKVFPEG